MTRPKTRKLVTKAKRSWDHVNSFADGGKSRCTCGHRGDGPNSEHEDHTSFAPGHGACKECNCSRFRWNGYIAEER